MSDSDTSGDSPTAVFQQHRALLFGIAYRMLGSVSEAEDMVQETFVRWQRQTLQQVQSAKAWLSAAITRLCIDQLRSARRRRETYVGVWLPEPLMGSTPSLQDRHNALADSLTTAFLVMLETLSPVERAVYLLREVFEYDYADIARIVEKSEDNCRQISRRARERVAGKESRYTADPSLGEKLMAQFLQACREGDTQGLLSMLTQDVVLYSDGGGKVAAAPQPVMGDQKVARFLIGVSKLRSAAGHEYRPTVINGSPGVLIFQEGRLVQTTSLHVVDGRIRALYIMRNPDKLHHLFDALPAEG